MNYQYLYIFLRLLLILGVLFIGALSIYYISSVTYPFIIAFVIALIINPFVDFLEAKFKIPRGFSVIIALTSILVVLAGLLTLLVAEIIAGSNYLAKVVPTQLEKLVIHLEQFFVSNIIPLYNQLTNMFETLDAGQQETIMNNIQNVGTTIATTVSNIIEKILKGIPDILGWLPNAATVLIFSLMATFFISKDWHKLQNWLRKMLPNKARESGSSILTNLKKAMFGFIRAQLTLISITAVIVLIGLLILGVDYAITISFIIGLVDLLPYLGTGLIFVPWIIYTFFSEQFFLTIGLSILYAIVIVQRQVMEPKVLSSSIGLDPLATLISLFIGFKLFGFLGLIVGPVTLVIIKALQHANVFQDLWHFIIGKKDAS